MFRLKSSAGSARVKHAYAVLSHPHDCTTIKISVIHAGFPISDIYQHIKGFAMHASNSKSCSLNSSVRLQTLFSRFSTPTVSVLPADQVGFTCSAETALCACRPIVSTFVERGLPSEILPETRSYIQTLFERYIGKGLVWLRSHADAEYVSSIDASLVATLADLFKARCAMEDA